VAWTGSMSEARRNVHKKFLIQAAACNLALLMRSLYGAGKPRAAQDQAVAAMFAILAFIQAVEDLFTPSSANYTTQPPISHRSTKPS
jgi:hypothetical protein